MIYITKYFKGEEIRNYNLSHVKEILEFLNRNDLKIKCFQNLYSSSFILKIDNATIELNSCREVCELLEPYFFDEKKKVFNELIAKKLGNLK